MLHPDVRARRSARGQLTSVRGGAAPAMRRGQSSDIVAT
jgi:hypothetical protein